MSWDETLLTSYINNRVQESITLEYKAAPSLQKADPQTNEISKDVSAFLNSAGGTIIYGIAEDQDHNPSRFEPINPKTITKEWLEHIINGKIRPRPDDVVIHPVLLSGTHVGKVCYAVEIPQGTTAHQASDRKYYRRYNFESVPMDDHEIKDVMNRRKTPRVTATLDVDSNGAIQVKLKNEGQITAYHIHIELSIPSDLFAFHKPVLSFDSTIIINEIKMRKYKYYLRQSDVLIPLLPGTEMNLFDGFNYYLQLKRDLLPANKEISCSVFADNASPYSTSSRI